MFDKNIVDELVALSSLRVQKIFGLFNSVVVMELYNPRFKRLYFVIDHNPATKSVHIQKNLPKGFKTRSMFITLLNKYSVNHILIFTKLSEHKIVARFRHDKEDYSLIVESTTKIAAGLFRGERLIASMRKDDAPSYEKGESTAVKMITDLAHNLRAASVHEQKLLDFHRTVVFNNLVATLKRDLSKKMKLYKNVAGDYEICQNNLKFLDQAELLKQNLHRMQRGMKEIDVMDYGASTPMHKKIVLDPSLSPQMNVEKLFNKVKRAKRGLLSIEPRLLLISDEVEKAKNQLEDICKNGPGTITFNDMVETLKEDAKPIKKTLKRLPYKTFLSADNIKILVGKSAKDSDDLTTHYACGSDWWFHTKDVAGAHVVVKSILDQLPMKTFLEAALLAMHFSKAKSDTHATIQYTRIKYIRKPKGVAAGTVLVAQAKTVDIKSDKEILLDILAQETH